MPLLISRKQLAEQRSWATAAPAKRLWALQEERARACPDEYSPDSGVWNVGNCVQCLDLAFAAAACNDPQLAEKTVRKLDAYLLKDRDAPAGAFLHDGMTSCHLAFVLGLMDVQMPPQIETRLLAALEKRARALEEFIPRTWKRWNSLHSNFGVVVGAGLAAAALALDNGRTKKRLETAMDTLKVFMSYYYRPDGGAPEGSHYWFYATLHALMAHHILLRAGIKDIMDWGFLGRTGRYGIALHSLENTPLHRHLRLHDTHDESFVSSSIPLRLGLLMKDDVLLSYWRKMYLREPVNQWTADWEAKSHARAVHRVVDHIMTLTWLAPEALDRPDEPLPKTMFFPDHGDAMLRTGWEKTDTFVHFHACRFACELFNWHYHRDHGSFTIQAGGEFLAADSGVTAYSYPEYQGWYCATASHNCITLEGADQIPPRVVPFHRFTQNEECEYLGLELCQAYKVIPAYWRRLIFLKPNIILLVDDIKSDKSAWWRLHAPDGASAEADGSSFGIVGRSMRLAVRFLAPRAPHVEILKSPKHREGEAVHDILQAVCPENEQGENGRQIVMAVMIPHPANEKPTIEHTSLDCGIPDCRAWKLTVSGAPTRSFLLVSNLSQSDAVVKLPAPDAPMRDCMNGEQIAPAAFERGIPVAQDRERLFIHI